MDLRPDPPTVEQYLRLRAASGLTPKTAAQAAPVLQNSWAWATVHADAQVVSMGRVLGDGGWYFHIADMATLPAFQRRGYGRAVLQALLERIHAAAPGRPWITLFADPPGRPLYRSLGFVPTVPGCEGMHLVTG
jgi:GNAT superfamily N-acetyltransferase